MTEHSSTTRRRRPARLVAGAFATSAGCSIGLTVLYAKGGQPQLEGLLLLGALGGLAVGFVLWAKRLMPEGPSVEEREPMVSPARDRAAFVTDFERGEEAIQRRTFLGRMLLGALATLGVAAVFPIRSLGPGPKSSLLTTSWRRGLRLVTDEGTPVAVEGLPQGSVVTVFPEGHVGEPDAAAVLLRIEPSVIRPLPGREAWSPQGCVAYSKLCTHAGCAVGLFEQSTNRLFCPCHQSVFDAVDGAEPVGGPATRPLPQLPLEVGPDGLLVAGGDFSGPVGPAFWDLPEGNPNP
jgi:ubiquinol-cytochrome c reductase iron-sulfur subunit